MTSKLQKSAHLKQQSNKVISDQIEQHQGISNLPLISKKHVSSNKYL